MRKEKRRRLSGRGECMNCFKRKKEKKEKKCKIKPSLA
jgi:hypothetical protein